MRHLAIFLAAVAAFAQQADYNTGLKNQPGWPSSAYNFTPVSFSGTINAGTYKTFSFSRCPAGVKGTNLGPSVTITGAANNGSGAIRITTAANGFKASNRITISGVGGTTEANGNWSITIISTTQFDLVGSTFANAYTSGGAAQQNVHYLYLSGGVGTAEIVPIGGGTCSSPGIAGTIQAYVGLAHSGTYTLRSATGGIMEAIWAQTADSRAVLISNSPTVYGPVWMTTNYQLDLYGRGQRNTVVTRSSGYTATIFLVDQASVSAGSSLVTLHDFWVYAPSMNAASGEGAIKFRNITCCGSRAFNITIWDDRNGVIVESSDNIDLDNIQYLQTSITAQPDNGVLWTQTPDYAISGAANNGSGLIRITAAANSYTTGTRVVVSGVTGTTEANGSWIVTVINSTTFDLQGSTFTNAYVSGGTAIAAASGFGNVSSGGSITNSSLITNEGFAQAGTNALKNGLLVESYDGLIVATSTLRGEYGIRINPVMVGSGVLVDSVVLDRSQYSAIAIGSQTTGAQGQIVVKGSWIAGNFAAASPLVVVDMTNISAGRFIFADNDIAGSTGACVQLISTKNVIIHDNTIVSCDTGATGKSGIEISTAATGLNIHDNAFYDIPTLGSTTQYALLLNANITNSSIHDNNIGTMQGASFLYQAGTNSNLKVLNNVTTEGLGAATVSAGNIAYATNLPPVVGLSGGGTATTVTGMWPGLKFQVVTSSATTFNAGGSNPGDFSRNLTTAAGQMVTFEMLVGGQVYVY